MSSCIIIPYIIFNLMAGILGPIYFNPAQKVTPAGGVLKGNISSSNELPQEFYGTWSVRGTVVTTNNPILFKDKSSDIWTFEKSGDIITLTNPVSGASASITVNDVKGNTATFTRERITAKLREYEKATITVNGDSFSGTDILTAEYYSRGKLRSRDTVKYNVQGSRISGARMQDIFAK